MSIRAGAAVQSASDIPDVHRYCDDWCDYCPVTARCVAFRIRQQWAARRSPGSPLTTADLVAFTREVAAASGRTTPGLDAMLAGDPERAYQPASADDWLVRTANQYALGAAFLLRTLGWSAPAPEGLACPPTAMDVVAWYYLLIAARAGRALVAAARADRGIPGEREDAQGCAKISLLGIDRSRAALKGLPGGRHERIARRLSALLDALAAGLEARIPEARSYVRVGLDAPLV